MKINVVKYITGLDGSPTDAVLRDVMVTSLLTMLKGDEGLSGGQKADLFRLAMTVAGNDEPDLKVEEIATLKERIGRAYPPLVVGRAYEILDPPAE